MLSSELLRRVFCFFCFFVFLVYPPKCLKVGTGHIATRYNGRKKKKSVLHLSRLETKVSRQRQWFNRQNERWSDELYEGGEGNSNKVMGESSKKILGSASEVFEQADENKKI